MPRELIVNAEWLDAVLDALLKEDPEGDEVIGCTGDDCKIDLNCTDCLIAHSNGKMREYEAPDLTRILTHLEYAAFNLCESASEISIRGIIDSTCPETSLLIAIRELKEIQKGEPGHE